MRRGLRAFLFGVPCMLFAQTSAYQSADGNTSIFLGNAKGSAIFNVSNTQFDLGYLHEGTGKTWMYGFDVTGKPSSDFSTLFEKGKTPPAVGGTASFGYHKPFAKGIRDQGKDDRFKDDWALLKVTYTRSAFETADNSTTEPVKRTFDGYTALAAYNALVVEPGEKSVTFIFGAAAGLQRENNLSQLTSATISTPLAVSATGIAPFTVTQQASSGYFGDYAKSYGAPLYTDAICIPKKLPWLDIDAFTRSDLAHANRYFEGGLGLYLASSSDVTKILGGVSMGWKNGTPTLGFVTGWSF